MLSRIPVGISWIFQLMKTNEISFCVDDANLKILFYKKNRTSGYF